MDNKAMSDLISRIKTEPSVLFLGQGYLSSFSGQDYFYDAVNRELCEGKAPAAPDYQTLWEHVNAGRPLQSEQFNQMYRVVCDLPTQNCLRSILSMRWGMVFTSAVDSCLTHCVGANFTFNALGYDKSHFKREYMSKSSLHGVYLYGSVDGSNGETPPAACDPKTMRSLKKRVNDRIAWIYNEILRDYGVLVIDGWNPKRDWLSFLLDNASDMPYHSIFLFGAAPEILDDETVQGLIEDEILTYYPQTFAQALEEYGYFQAENVSWDSDFTAGEGGKTVTIRSKSGRDISLLIPFSALDVLDSRITLLDDDLGFENQRRSIENRSEAFARYLQQNSTPIWALCTLQANFHFERSIDDELWNTADTLLRQKASYRRGLLVLEGVSNSGKTASLVHFAMRIREEHHYPVFYISGNPTQTAFAENLKNFIKRYLQGRQDSDGAWVERVIVLWDGNLSSDAVRQYTRLSRDLAECNALVIGTIYRHDSNGSGSIVGSPSKGGITYLPVQATLTQNEKKALNKLLHDIDPALSDRFQAAVNRVSEPNLIYLLQHIARYQYSPEWKAVYTVLKERFDAEVDRSESNAQRAMEDFQRRPTEEEVHAEIVKHGVGAAWQMALARKLEEMQKNGTYPEEPLQEEEQGEEAKTDSSKALLADIRLLNETLAMAGQFSISMPVTLLLDMIHHDGNILSKENMFLNKLLANDSLVDYSRDEEGYPFVRFRHPREAELYVEKNFGGDPDSRHKLEIELLCKLIASCHWNEDEAYDVIALIRCFGPNSAGKYSQDISRGNYDDYISFLPEIADCLMRYADGNPEAMLVFAHFLRETYSANQKSGQPNSRNYLLEAKNKLRIAMEQHDQQNLQQYNRLVVEMCSNMVASMPRNHTANFDRDIFREFQNMFKLAVNTWDSRNTTAFGTNSLLDIWLNGVTKFYHSFQSDEEAMKAPELLEALASSLDYIDQLFEVSTDFSSTNLLEKVEQIYRLDPKRSMDTIVKRLERQGNDTFLYLNARRCWLSGASLRQGASEEDIIRSNLFLLPDDADAHVDLLTSLPDLVEKASVAAGKAVKLLEDNMEMIQRSRSSRCLHMLIRAKWLLYTGHMPLEEKQQPTLSADQWKEIFDLCRSYSIYCTNNNLRAQNLELLLQAVYLWSFTSDVGQAKTIFSQLRQQMGSSWYVERIGLCVPGQKTLRTFYVDVERNVGGNYTARIAQEITRGSSTVMDLRGRYGIHISTAMQNYLFDGQTAHSQYCIRKPVTIWFTANGPSLGPDKEARGLK